jgi:ATP-dependent exoDNAse (exonuclease V) alpha subunit
MHIEKNERFLSALEAMESATPFVFITGKAGTGKSTLLSYFREHTKKRCVYLAPTGVAALNIQGQTLHSFFLFPPHVTTHHARYLGKATRQAALYKNIDTIVIDEISMVRADLLDCVDEFLRKALKSDAPFAGKQIIAIGDVFQLPPVVLTSEKNAFAQLYRTPYFFSSSAFDILQGVGAVSCVELDRIYRQKDERFIELLNNIRTRTCTDADIAALNERIARRRDNAITLTATNAASATINTAELNRITHKSKVYRGTLKGDFSEKDVPADLVLELKIGARVMCTANAADGSYVNGSLGTVKKMDETSVTVNLDQGGDVAIIPYTWSMYRAVFNVDSGSLDQERMGSYIQLPLRLAWAVTIHKSQGKTFDKVTIDLGRGAFAHGQTYVALSRCRTLDGITLCQPLRKRDIVLDEDVLTFMNTVLS